MIGNLRNIKIRNLELMMIIETPYHISFSSCYEIPAIACVGKCKKVWWQHDFEGRAESECPMCNGEVVEGVKGVHFNVIKSSNRNFRPKELKKFKEVFGDDLEQAISLVKKGITITHASKVKPKFIAYAKQHWA